MIIVPIVVGAAKREIMPGVEHCQHKDLNNRAENSHQPTQPRERIIKRFQIRATGSASSFSPWLDQQSFSSSRQFFIPPKCALAIIASGAPLLSGLRRRLWRGRRVVTQSCNRPLRILISLS
jgi:hypothetical protein